jgi:hypothetical protein
VKILEPIAVIAEVVKLEPAGSRFIKINSVLGFSLPTLFLPTPCKIAPSSIKPFASAHSRSAVSSRGRTTRFTAK